MDGGQVDRRRMTSGRGSVRPRAWGKGDCCSLMEANYYLHCCPRPSRGSSSS